MNTREAESQNKLSTRQELIYAGEQLFAQKGIDAVSLRQVNMQAGQKNSSASHYHFGSKKGLVAAIYEFRMERVNSKRLAMLEKLNQAGGQPSIRELVSAVVCPIAEEISQDNGDHYIRFMAQAVSSPNDYVSKLSESPNAEALLDIAARLRQLLSPMPEEIFVQRFGLMIDQTIHALADREKLSPKPFSPNNESLALFVSNLIDSLAGAFEAPVSAETSLEIKRNSRRKA